MSYTVNGYHISYDYKELIIELQDLLELREITESAIINIVRDASRDIAGTGYHPIIDFYLPGAEKEVYEPLENLYIREEYTDDEWNKMLADRDSMIRQYENDLPKFEKASVLAVLTEMMQWDSLI